jgi:hypothetical protein
MALETEVGLVLALLGLGGCVLFLVAGRLRTSPGLVFAFFLGVFLYLFLHDAADALQSETVVRLRFGPAFSFFLVAAGVLLGGGFVSVALANGSGEGRVGMPLVGSVAGVLALHASADGIVIGTSLASLTPEQVLDAGAFLLQVIHRALEGGVLVAVMLLAGMKRSTIFAAVVFVGLPLAATTTWAAAASLAEATAAYVLLAFVEAGAFLVLFLVGLWPLVLARGERTKAVRWLLVGFLVTLVVHAVAH